jgi:hypothetical protein
MLTAVASPQKIGEDQGGMASLDCRSDDHPIAPDVIAAFEAGRGEPTPIRRMSTLQSRRYK